jgi:hypothetical protein
MSVYVDTARHPFKGYVMCHMVADSLDELHGMAARIGMERRWFQTPPKASFPHYDIPEHKRGRAISLGAHVVCQRTGLYFAARLGLEWAALEKDHIRHDRYARTMARTQIYAAELRGNTA